MVFAVPVKSYVKRHGTDTLYACPHPCLGAALDLLSVGWDGCGSGGFLQYCDRWMRNLYVLRYLGNRSILFFVVSGFHQSCLITSTVLVLHSVVFHVKH